MFNNILSRLRFQYSFLLKNISCFIYLIVKETSSEKIEKLHELSLILKSHACVNITHDVIFTFFSDYWLFLLYTFSMDWDKICWIQPVFFLEKKFNIFQYTYVCNCIYFLVTIIVKVDYKISTSINTSTKLRVSKNKH